MIVIMDALPSNAKELRYIQIQTWLDTYPNKKMGISKKDIREKLEEMNKDRDERIAQKLTEENSRAWLAKNKSKIVGFIGVHKGSEGVIEVLHVLPKFQNRGIGKKLMETALVWLGRKMKISVEVVNYNKKAINFYKSFGFLERRKAPDDPILLPSGKIIEKILMILE